MWPLEELLNLSMYKMVVPWYNMKSVSLKKLTLLKAIIIIIHFM